MNPPEVYAGAVLIGLGAVVLAWLWWGIGQDAASARQMQQLRMYLESERDAWTTGDGR